MSAHGKSTGSTMPYMRVERSKFMEKRKSLNEQYPIINTVLGLLVLLVIIVLGFYILQWIGAGLLNGIEALKEITSHLDVVIIVSLITGTVSIVTVFISTVLGKIIDYNKSRQEYLAQKRESTYEGFIDMFYKIMDSKRTEKNYSQDEMIKDMMSFSKSLTLWGSKRVVRKWVKFRNNDSAINQPTENLKELEDILNEMRRDMHVGKAKKWTLIRFFVNDIDENGKVINK